MPPKHKVKKQEDCYFYYYSMEGCTKGSCTYRHEPASKGNDERCQAWLLDSKCTRDPCPFRHMERNKDRSKIPCYHQTQEGGCKKTGCPFKHSDQQGIKTSPEASTKLVDQGSFQCFLCDVKCPNASIYKSHLEGKKHRNKVAEQLNLPAEPEKSKKIEKKDKKENQEKPKTKPNLIYCKPCDTMCPNKHSYDQHARTDKHKKNMANFLGAPSPIPTSAPLQMSVQLQRPPPLMAFPPAPMTLMPFDLPPPPPYSEVAPPARPPSVGANPSGGGAKPKNNRSKSANPVRAQSRGQRRGQSPGGKYQKPEGVAFFWDIENCRLKRGMSVVDMVKKLRSQFLDRGSRELLFQVALDQSKPYHQKTVTSLSELGVDVLSSSPGKKNSADDVLRQKMRSFVDNIPQNQRARLVLVSGDVDFAPDLRNFRYSKNHEVFLMHNKFAKDTLKSIPHKCFSFEGFIKDFPIKEEANKPQQQTNKPANKPENKQPEVNCDPPQEKPQKNVTQNQVIMLWDTISCPPKDGFSATDIAMKMREDFISKTDGREVAFMAVCPPKSEYRGDLIKELEEVCVSIESFQGKSALESLQDALACVQNSADISHIVIMSNNTSLGSFIQDVRFKRSLKCKIVVIHDSTCAEGLRSLATETVVIDHFVGALRPREDLKFTETKKTSSWLPKFISQKK